MGELAFSKFHEQLREAFDGKPASTPVCFHIAVTMDAMNPFDAHVQFCEALSYDTKNLCIKERWMTCAEFLQFVGEEMEIVR